ncbi:class I mannose-6-phosphate isomerase [Aeoliella sp. ICT_H6.2]|uniref:Class I mannose-6-phosphate isomerase n=1 Tax=Aeoliella straminimaris TaxID=2954799 RepID=A0A9X2FC85_9BACT|nr:class I mannose-6-phosphate isomerase [Aeoliella straminimaris]MCO6046367.1 class I mannose-6-phosphate isomerase [Aeoliella straminimaris]
MRRSTYNKKPIIQVPATEDACVAGWNEIGHRLAAAVKEQGSGRIVLAVDCYPGVDVDYLLKQFSELLKPVAVCNANQAMLESERVEALVEPYLGGEDLVFGYLSPLTLPAWFDEDRTAATRNEIRSSPPGLVLVVGPGATHLVEADILVYADLARWEAQGRFRRNEASNLGIENRHEDAKLQYKRAFFVDWRVADRWKLPLLERCDFVLDTHNHAEPKLATGEAVRRGLEYTVSRPFRVVPFFDPAPWGGQWMREVCDLDRDPPNYGWCFDCVPEENSLLLGIADTAIEIPSLDLVLRHPKELLGDRVFERFGVEFPIRFDFLDTMGGGNLSFQVHPLTSYIQKHFGMNYTQDESYYLLDAGPEASVYLGLREGVDCESMIKDLQRAQAGEIEFDADAYANRFPAKKHDHFLIPAGTCHCSGSDSMVLEISATPYIFTFKMWDWGRLGLDGLPRPIHLDHGIANIQWDRTTAWVERELVNQIQTVDSGKGWREEVTGLHKTEFIETRRHWFTEPVDHNTNGGVNVLNLVEGSEAIVESPSGAFEPFVVHYAETFIVPAAVGRYRVRAVDADPQRPHATVKAFVRH